MAMKIQNHKKLLFGVIAAVVVLIALLTGIGIYNTPENRVNRHLELANKYLEEMDYEQAVVEFAKVIGIEPMNVDAYLGKAQAHIGLGDYDMAIETLKEGYLATQEDGRNGDVLENLENCLEQYINTLLAEGKDDEVRALIEKYKDVLAGTDFDAFLTQVETRMRETGYASLLSQVQELIIAENYEQVNALVKTPECQDMLNSLQDDGSYYYGERDQYGNRDGVGTAVCKGYRSVYFYYGSWSEGEKSGQGLALNPSPDNPTNPYGLFTGEWAHDLPNGEGEERYQVIQSELEGGTGRDSLHRGLYKDGLFDGDIYIEVTWADEGVVSYQGTAKNGVWELQSEVEDGEAVMWNNLTDPTSSGMWSTIEDNKDNGVTWVLPSSYKEEE